MKESTVVTLPGYPILCPVMSCKTPQAYAPPKDGTYKFHCQKCGTPFNVIASNQAIGASALRNTD
jgi:hypothetical protein